MGLILNGSTPIDGVFVDLRINGNEVSSGYTPVTFNHLQLGVQYGIVIYWYGDYYIRYIKDSNTGIDLQRYDLVTLTKSNASDTLTGMFEYVPPSQAASLNIIAEFPNGTSLGTASVVNGYDLHSPGMWLTLTPPFQSTPYTGTFTGGSILPFILFNHETYTIAMSPNYCGPWVTNLNNTGPYVYIAWSHWQDDGNTDPTRAITLDGNATYVAIYYQTTAAGAGCAAAPTITSTTTTGSVGASAATTAATTANSLASSTQLSSSLIGLGILAAAAPVLATRKRRKAHLFPQREIVNLSKRSD